MSAVFFKRALMWSLPAVLLNLLIQYHESGKLTASAVAVSVVIFLLGGLLFEALNSWWTRKFEKSPFSRAVSAGFWAIVAIGLFVFFYRMS
ncbi:MULTISPECIES: hypothetical protein [Paraburkholderia]|uniref:Uncharacterized protein n=2 Tax=Paraburkholderia TaxID=1822464 RepID=A0A7Z0AYN3_9BURK|nr:hypothetical protein [Paraburkholderia bryophila]NYH14734.1 hypothetical protein [Paraburkholderia bryophila]NYH26945.1 hypothetical protein [Paraburkholderia bryophila]